MKLTLLTLLFWLSFISIVHWFECWGYRKDNQCHLPNGHYEFKKVIRCDNLTKYRENKSARKVYQDQIEIETNPVKKQLLIEQLVAIPYEKYNYPVCKTIETPLFIPNL